MQQTQMRPPRTRSSGGRTLMLLGLVLALAAAAIVFYITTSVQGTFGQATEQVVAAKADLKVGTILSLTNPTAPYMLTTDAFKFESINKNDAPADAVMVGNQDQLNAILNDQIIVQQFLQGDILRNNDPRLALVGTAPANSVTELNPTVLKNGQVLVKISSGNNNTSDYVQGDTLDIIASIKVLLKNGDTDLITQTTLTNVLVYAVDTPNKGDVWIVLSNQDALYLQEMVAGGFVLEYVIRKPGDPTDPSGQNPQGGNGSNDQPTTPVDDNSILNHFGFTPPQ